ncbi:MAG: flagellar type III secretion system protein FliR [Epsilonproteobacteria bacterium]|nr:flagellar type III secretion system protein FliR [Campylobacterota bacterium]
MQSLVEFLGQNHVILFMLLFARISGLFAFFPFFSHSSIPVVVKTSLAIFMVVFLYPLATLPNIEINVVSVTLAVVSELLMGLIAGLILNLVFGMLQLAGMQIAFVMGFTLASVIDPQSNSQSPIISQILTLIGLLVLLSFNMHHLMLIFLAKSLHILPLGAFYPGGALWAYLVKSVSSMFIYGFILSFPIVGLSLLADLVFGMLMKTMPQFNLLVVGFPIKIMVGLVVLIAVLAPMMLVFKREFQEALNHLFLLF